MIFVQRLLHWGGRLGAACLVTGLLLGGPAHAMAQTPGPAPAPADGREPIRVLIGLPPGSGVDQVSRVFAEALSQRLYRPVLIENRTGGCACLP